MEKFYTYTMISATMMVLLYVAGVTPTVAISYFASPDALQGLANSSLVQKLLVTAVASLIFLGISSFATKTVSDMPITAFAGSLFYLFWIGYMTSVVIIPSQGYEKVFLLIILAPYSLLYAVALYDWIRGRD